MKPRWIYDLPTRFFHWLFAFLFVFSFVIAKNVDDDSPTFSYHMLAGLLLAFIVILRLIWGAIGTKNARFASFALRPNDLISYMLGVFSRSSRRWSGHNPASSWGTLVMLALAMGLAVTGYLMSTGQKETFEDIHEWFANGFLVMVLMHIVGVAMHAFKHRDGIAFTMFRGTKADVPESDMITSQKPLVALAFVILVASFAFYLASNFNQQTQTLKIFGSTLQLGEGEG